MCSSSTETDSHSHHCSPGLLTSLTYGDGYMTGLPVHSPSSHPLSTTPRRAFPSLTRALPYYSQEQTQFLPRIFKASTRWAQPTPPVSSPSPGFLLRAPQTCQPYPCFTPPAIPSSLPAPLFLLSLPTAPNFFSRSLLFNWCCQQRNLHTQCSMAFLNVFYTCKDFLTLSRHCCKVRTKAN